jgi:hypothetical protein
MPAVSAQEWHDAELEHRAVEPLDTRPAFLAWLAGVVPDLRVRVGLVDGVRLYVATFTADGAEREVSAAGETDLECLRATVDKLREWLELPPLGVDKKDAELEQKIVRAHLEGDVAACEAMTTRLVMGRRAIGLEPRTQFHKREIW